LINFDNTPSRMHTGNIPVEMGEPRQVGRRGQAAEDGPWATDADDLEPWCSGPLPCSN
jgi:hypothetical protein